LTHTIWYNSNLMKRPYLITLLIALFTVWQLLLGVKSLEADTVPGNKTNIDNNTSVQHPTIFFKEPDFDFGKIYKGQKVEHVYIFENAGKDTLNIKEVKTSCGCTAAILTNHTIPPAETGEIRVTYNPGSNTGNVKKSITVLNDDPEHSSYRLTIFGEIIEDVSVKPKNVDFGSIYIGKKTNKSKTISIESESTPDFKIKKITSSKPFIEASISEEKNGKYVVEIVLKDNPGIGRFSGGIFLETNSQTQEKLNIPFFGEIVGDVTTYPKKLYFGSVLKGKELSQKLYVKVNNNNIKILEIKILPDYLSTKIVEKRESKNPHYLIEVRLLPEATTGKINGVLELHTNSKIQPITRIPILGTIENS
jgi:hypothetical protein